MASILQIGCGRWGINILRELVDLDCRVRVVDPDPVSRERAKRLGARDTSAQIPDGEDIDGIVIATPASSHAGDIEACRDFGRPVFVEKPLTVSAASASRLSQLELPPTFVMHVWRYHGAVELLARIAREDELGAIGLLRSTRVNWTSPRTDVDPIWTLLPHDISIAIEILGGFPTPMWAQAERHGGSAVGIIAGLSLGDVAIVVECSTRHTTKRREVRLHCEHGVATFENDASGVQVRRDDAGRDVRLESADTSPPLRRELERFVAYLGGGPPPKCDLTVGAEVVNIVSRLREMAGIR